MRRTSRLMLLATCATLLCCLVAVTPAFAYKLGGRPWPHGRVTFYNEAKRDEANVRAAVRAWNQSGARIRLVETSRARAHVIIRYRSTKSCMSAGLGTLGAADHGGVWLFGVGSGTVHYGGVTEVCDPHAAQGIIAHELGHNLGLDHNTRSCALMNPSSNSENGSFRGGDRCHSDEPLWKYRCRLLEHDDVAGVVHRYGGRIRPLGPAFCEGYTPEAAPQITLAIDATSGVSMITVTMHRSGSKIPPWMTSPFFGNGGYHIEQGPTCVTTAANHDTVAAGASGTDVTSLTPTAPGSTCVSVWYVDTYDRISPTPATAEILVP